MTFEINPVRYTRENIGARIDKLTWSKGWRPSFLVLHNTGVPSLKQIEAWSATGEKNYEYGLRHYYGQTLGWHSGPHYMVMPDGIWELCDPEQDGVHASCFNHVSIGIEMGGNYEVNGDDFENGAGLQVQEGAIELMSQLHHRLWITPDPLVIGHKGLHFHRMCERDHHACPGSRVDRAKLVPKIEARMHALGSGGLPAPKAS